MMAEVTLPDGPRCRSLRKKFPLRVQIVDRTLERDQDLPAKGGVTLRNFSVLGVAPLVQMVFTVRKISGVQDRSHRPAEGSASTGKVLRTRRLLNGGEVRMQGGERFLRNSSFSGNGLSRGVVAVDVVASSISDWR